VPSSYNHGAVLYQTSTNDAIWLATTCLGSLHGMVGAPLQEKNRRQRGVEKKRRRAGRGWLKEQPSWRGWRKTGGTLDALWHHLQATKHAASLPTTCTDGRQMHTSCLASHASLYPPPPPCLLPRMGKNSTMHSLPGMPLKASYLSLGVGTNNASRAAARRAPGIPCRAPRPAISRRRDTTSQAWVTVVHAAAP